MYNIQTKILTPPNLSILGLKRHTPQPQADLVTIARSGYPTLSLYEIVCKALQWHPYGGGSVEKQANKILGYIHSGYRDGSEGLGMDSAHNFAMAIDAQSGTIKEQIKAAYVAQSLFERIGLYPENGIIHLDICDIYWREKYEARRYWIRSNDIYTYYDDFKELITAAMQFS